LDRRAEGEPAPGLGLELLPAQRAEAVVAGPSSVLRRAPLREEEPLFLQAVGGRGEGPLIHLQGLAPGLLDALREPPAVLRAEAQGLEDEQVERALQQVLAGRRLSHRRLLSNVDRRTRDGRADCTGWSAARCAGRAVRRSARLSAPRRRSRP